MSNPLTVADDFGGRRVSVERVVSALTALAGALVAVLVALGQIGGAEGAQLEERLTVALERGGPLISIGILWWNMRGRQEP